ncbi:hypothetical protein PMAYCL1PPCAC_22879 [Pristionchus mayeri]|uniref:Uncharacterized protein n=1 Tax=Pristionchus mayeri TaxID=1317129 RepID=A0AAN5CXV6_9BILA|nr:hypothetical protein PMAYCL1PPCAC_22879 [Pristionchus mayeri]
MAPTPDQIYQFNKARAAMKADPSFLNDSIALLTPEAQEHAIAITKLQLNLNDIRISITAIRAPLSAEIIKEIDAHRERLVEKYGLPKRE